MTWFDYRALQMSKKRGVKRAFSAMNDAMKVVGADLTQTLRLK
jgi:hypothetical protein